MQDKGLEQTPWHSMSVQETLNMLNCSVSGLSQNEAQKRLDEYGENVLSRGQKTHPLLRFLAQFHNILIYVLIACALVTTALGHIADTLVILAVVLINALVGYVQEGKAEQALDAIRQILAPKANVLRDGQRVNIDGEQLVPGDVVLLEAGDKVAADLRIISSHGLSIQEAILTGESMPVDKDTESVSKQSALGDRVSMAFSGTLVTSGKGKALVVASGQQTELGRISGLLAKVEPLTTPLVAQMNQFAKWLTFIIFVIALALLGFTYFASQFEFTDMFMAVVGLSVAAIPEGLPAVLTITLAIGVKAMAHRNAIVRHLPAIETLGSVSVICSDKTGTLTRNQMMVVKAITHAYSMMADGTGYSPKGSVTINDEAVSIDNNPIAKELAQIAVLCNDAALRQHKDAWVVEGDPMEGALLAFSAKLGADADDIQEGWKLTDTIAFDAKHRFMATLHHDHDEHAFIFVKGAPERMLAMCSAQRAADGSAEALDEHYWNQQIEEVAGRGQRLLALAIKPIDCERHVLEHKDLEEGLVLVGMLAMVDPPRLEAIEAIAQCHDAGIQVKMITGDHAKTAAAIAKQIGLNNTDMVLRGEDIDRLDDKALKEAVLECDIYARTSPEHKLRLVMALQSHNMTVAMTGDGVNDAPSLKRADVGIAMGKNGSEAAKEAADVVLADDNFASIVAAIREGRTVYDNLKKVISWTLPTNAGEASTIIVALLLGMTMPITPIQILWVNLITAVTLGIALAFEPTEASTMKRMPRSRDEPLLNKELIWYVVLVSFLFLCGVFGSYHYAIERGYSIELARTIALNTLVVMEIFQLFFIRNIYASALNWEAVRGTKIVWTVVVIITLAQFAMTYLPPLQSVFATASIPLIDGVLIIAIGVALFIIIELEKRLRMAVKRRYA
ncbi:cation-transporting P-type ATPase [Glaciecola sp. XM2]|uniref:cation-transporting P-type ATPase n=1 Tax=Glaciecola sp. XM2 TaxID=1914931 RepID=UPI001BDF4B66|nr:cation-transporting P-type ATPase [Glaciecola sp. XM2]MBT1450071.1 cation-transporting P-type ATPase [Glaciecola sp. XM2]